MTTKKSAGRGAIATNRKARHDYSILETVEAGLVLTGTEVKALREGRASLAEGYATVSDNEIWLREVHIAEYLQGTWNNHNTRRARKVLLHRSQIDHLADEVRQSHLALIPLSLYFSNGIVKLELALARGKRSYDKRQDLAERDARREVERAVSDRYKRGRRPSSS